MKSEIVDIDLSEERILFIINNNISGVEMDIQYVKPFVSENPAEWKDYMTDIIDGIDLTISEAQNAGIVIPQETIDEWARVKPIGLGSI